MSEPQIDRDTYRKIMKMSREELNDSLIGYANNLTQDSTVDLREMEKKLLSIPGIGHKRVEQIMTVIENYLGVYQMKIEMGESLFYSWLRHVKQCQIVQMNWKVSPLWELKHNDELASLMDLSDEFFSQKHGYRIFKKNVSLSQIIRQGECDVIGINIENGVTTYYAVDVAFHESGLNYGSRQETVMKIAEKIIRTAMCLYGYFDARCAEIVSASPKINPAVLYDANL